MNELQQLAIDASTADDIQRSITNRLSRCLRDNDYCAEFVKENHPTTFDQLNVYPRRIPVCTLEMVIRNLAEKFSK